MESPSIAKLLRTLGEYQLAISSYEEQGKALTDYHAQDFRDIAERVGKVLEEFIRREHHGNNIMGTDRIGPEWRPKIPWNGAGEVMNFTLKAFKAYLDYRQTVAMEEHVRIKLHTQRQAGRRIRRRREEREQGWQWLWHEHEKEQEQEQDDEDDEDDEENAQSVENREQTNNWLETSVAIATAGVGLASGIHAFSSSVRSEREMGQVYAIREGSEETGTNADFTLVTPVSTGRLIALDADTIIEDLQSRGVQVPDVLRQTSGDIRKLSGQMSSCLENIEGYHAKRAHVQRVRAALASFAVMGALFHLFGPAQRTRLRRFMLLVPLLASFTRIVVLGEPDNGKEEKQMALVQSHAILHRLQTLRQEQSLRKQAIQAAARDARLRISKRTQIETAPPLIPEPPRHTVRLPRTRPLEARDPEPM